MEQLEFDPPDLSNKPHSRTVVVPEGVDSLPPLVTIEVEVEKDGPVSLELLTKLVIVGARVSDSTSTSRSGRRAS